MMFCLLTDDMNDDEVIACMHAMHRRLQKDPEHGFLLTISGYDKDSRELWDIPSVVQFCQKLVDIGFLSLLEPIPQMVDPGTPGFGAVEVWMMANGRIKTIGQIPIVQKDVIELFSLIEASNVKLKKIISQPCPKTDIVEEEMIFKSKKQDAVPDGQHYKWRK